MHWLFKHIFDPAFLKTHCRPRWATHYDESFIDATIIDRIPFLKEKGASLK